MALNESRLYPKNKTIASVFISTPIELTNQARERLSPANENEPRRRMIQTAEPFAVFEFGTPPNQINFDGMAAEYAELPRPLMNPAIDVKNSRSYRASFEFLVAHVETLNGGKLVDGIYVPVHNQLKTLELMANRPIPVRFENFDTMLTSSTWYINEMTFNAVRYNKAGEITSCQVSLSLIAYQQQTTRFVSVPSISYKPKTKKATGDKKDAPLPDGVTESDIAKLEQISLSAAAGSRTKSLALYRLAQISKGINPFRTDTPLPKR